MPEKCQHCKLPLVIHDSLEELSIAQSNLLALPRSSSLDSSTLLIGEDAIIPLDRFSLLQKLRSHQGDPLLNLDSTDSYVLLPNESANSNTSNTSNISDNVNALDKISELLNSHFDNEIDYPVCSFCADLIISQIKTKLDHSVKEKQIYLQFANKLASQPSPAADKSQEHVLEIDQLSRHELELQLEHDLLMQEQQLLQSELHRLQLENEALVKEELALWALKNQRELHLGELASEHEALQLQHRFNESQLDKLKKSNVYNDVFKISHEGQFGTISGLRLGNLDSCRISWHEINAALGQLVLLLATLVNKLNVNLHNYTLVPLASYSKIEKHVKDPNGVSKKVVLECFSSGDSSLQRLVNHYKFDGAMCALLDVLKQLQLHLYKIDSSIELPYKMENDKIGDWSIKLQSKVTSEEWTTACKCLLINTKWLLAYSSAHN